MNLSLPSSPSFQESVMMTEEEEMTTPVSPTTATPTATPATEVVKPKEPQGFWGRAGHKLNQLNMYQTMFGTAIGLATHGAISSIVNNLAFPLLGLLFFGNSFRQWTLALAGTNLDVGHALGDIVAFVLTILVILGILEAFPFILESIQEQKEQEEATEHQLLGELHQINQQQRSQRWAGQ